MSEACGCKIIPAPYEIKENRLTNWRIFYCPLHASADDMLELLKTVAQLYNNGNRLLLKEIKDIIKRAEGKAGGKMYCTCKLCDEECDCVCHKKET